MGPDELPPTADSRARKEDLPNHPDATNTMLTTPVPVPQKNSTQQILATPTPPETNSETTKKMGNTIKSKDERLSLAPGSSADLASPRTSNNQRELSPTINVNSPRQSTNQSVASSESNRNPLALVTQGTSRQKGDKGEQPASDDLQDEPLNPGAIRVGLRGNTHDFTVTQPPSTAVLQAEVAPDMDEAIQRAVQDALRQRDEQMAMAAVVANPAGGTPGETNGNDEESPKDGMNDDEQDDDNQSFNKKILYAGVGIVILVIVIVVAVTVSGGGDESGASNQLSTTTTESPTTTFAPTGFSAPSTSPGGPDTTRPPTFLLDNLSGDCALAVPIFSTGWEGSVTNEAVTTTYVNEECNVDVDDPGIWFRLEVPEGNEMSIGLFTVSRQSFLAKMSIYTGSSCDNLRCIGITSRSNDTPRTFEQVLESGVSYHIFVAGDGSDQTGSFYFEFESAALDNIPQPTQGPVPNIIVNPTKAPALGDTPLPTLLPTASPTTRITPLPTIMVTPSPTARITPAPTLPTNIPADCRSAAPIMAGFSQIVSTVSGLNTFIDQRCVLREGDRGIWFKYVPTYEAMATMRATEQNFSAKLAYFTGTCDFPICGERTTSGPQERVLTFYSKVGEEYLLFVGGNGADNEGTVQLTLDAPSPPEFSYCAGAIDVSNSLPYEQVDSTINTVPTISNSECVIDMEDRGTWYKYVATRDVIITVILASQERNTRMAHFAGSSCESLECGGFAVGSVSPRTLVFHGKPGEENYVLVASNGLLNAGSYRLRIIESVPPENSYFTGAAKVTFKSSNVWARSEETTQFTVPSFVSEECFVREGERGLWYRYTPTVESIVTVTVSGVSGTSFSKRLSIYSTNCFDDECESLSCVEKTSLSVASERVADLTAELGTDYFFLVSGSKFEEAGIFDIRFETSDLPPN